jgi:uncharacterized protein (DUF2236 family)
MTARLPALPAFSAPARGLKAYVRRELNANVHGSGGLRLRERYADPPGDPGLFGPGAVTWRVHSDAPGMLMGGFASLMLQSLHPLAMAGVAQHSDYRNRALDRLRRTAGYVTATTFGDTETAHAAAARVKAVHRRVHGIDPVTGRAYSADDPDTQLWVHCVEWHSFLAVYRAYGGRLSPEEQDAYIAEGVRVAALLDVPAERVPASVDEMRDYFESVRPELCISEHARAAIEFVIHPPMTRELLPLQVPLRIVARAAVATVPRHLRALAGLEGPRSVDAVTVAAVRPAAAALTLPLLRDAPGLVLGAEVRAVRDSARALAA